MRWQTRPADLITDRGGGSIGRAEVSVVDGDVKDIVLTPGGVSVIGQVVTIGNGPSPSATVRLKMTSNSVQSRDSKTSGSGAFTIPNVVSGTWQVVVSDLSANLALLDVRQGDASIYENGFLVDDRTPSPVQVILGAAGSIGGIVRDDPKGPIGAAQIIVIPESPDPSRPATFFKKATTDGKGVSQF